MNRNEMVKELAATTGLGAQTVDVVVGRLFELVARELEAGRDVSVAGFGAFAVRDRAARAGRNPRTGEALAIAASRAAAFKPAKALRDRLNPGR